MSLAVGPVGFALVDGLGLVRRSVAAFYVVPALRRTGIGRELAHAVLAGTPGPWAIAFQHDNLAAGRFWRAVASEVFGSSWTEEQQPVPGRPDLPGDHWIQA